MTKRSTYLLLFIMASLSACQEENLLKTPDATLKLKGKVKSIAIKSATENTSTKWLYDDAQAVKAYQINNLSTNTSVVETYIKDATGKITSIRIEDQTTKATYERKLEYNDRGFGFAHPPNPLRPSPTASSTTITILSMPMAHSITIIA